VSDAVFAEAVVARRARIAHCRTEQGSWPIQCNSTVWSIPLTSKRRRRSGRAAGRLTSLAALCVLPVCVAAIIAVDWLPEFALPNAVTTGFGWSCLSMTC